MPDNLLQPLLEIGIAQEPDQPVEQQILYGGIEIKLRVAGNLVVEPVDFAVESDQVVAVAHGREGGGDGRGRGAGLVGNTHDQRGAAAVDHRVRELRRDDLAPQPMRVQRVVIVLRHFLGEIALELAPEIGIVRHRAVEQIAKERELGIGQQHRQLRPCQRQVALAAVEDRHLVGQEFHRAIELPVHFQRLHEPLLEAEVLQSAPLRQG